ncbi:hypothetical protein ACEQPO_19305 [Bacillus sp. SL00103]
MDFLRSEIERTEALRCEANCSPSGCTCRSRTRSGNPKIIEGLNEVIVKGQKVQIALETMAGKGSECGRSF